MRQIARVFGTGRAESGTYKGFRLLGFPIDPALVATVPAFEHLFARGDLIIVENQFEFFERVRPHLGIENGEAAESLEAFFDCLVNYGAGLLQLLFGEVQSIGDMLGDELLGFVLFPAFAERNIPEEQAGER